MERTFKVRNFWTMLEMESQEASEDNQNKENINKHTPSQLAFFASARK